MVFTEYRLINKLVTVVMVRWVEEMGENWGVREKKERRKRRKEVIKKIGSKRKIRRRKKKKMEAMVRGRGKRGDKENRE
ncbi:hypothetical protein I8Y06_003686 [Photobacterium damselae]|nr:hypothetical protein [Photobacterium damselae]